MTTGMRTEPTVERRRRSKWNWLWLLVAAIIALALVGYATTPKPSRNGDATTQSVQDSATGQQGAVGGFNEQVVPNGEGATDTNSRGTVNNNTPGSQPATGEGVPAAESSRTGSDMSAGNSGIPSVQEGLGGGRIAGDKSGATQKGSNGQDMGNDAK